MNYHPLIERQLRLVLRRRGGGYGLRLLYAAGSTVAAFGILFVWSAWRPGAGFGRPFLQTLAAGGYLLALLTGMVLVADSLSREKREGTLDLLLLTDLRTGDVVLGKLFASIIVPLYGFLAIVPMLQISVLVGGTSLGECVRLFLVWINALFFSLAASLLVSAKCYEQRTAHAGTVLLMLLLAAGLPLLSVALSASVTPVGAYLWLMPLLLSPTGPYQFANNYSSLGGWFWTALLVNHGLSWLFLLSAKRALLRSLTAKAVSPESQISAFRCPTARHRTRTSQLQLLNARPIQWLVARRSRIPWALWGCTLGGVGLSRIYGADPFGSAPERFGFMALAIAHVVLKLGIGTDAVHSLSADRRSGALESLLATEISVAEITSGIFRQFWRRMAGPVLVLALGSILAARSVFGRGYSDSAILLGVAGLILPLESYCLFWVGLFQGLAARNAAVGLATTTLEIVLLPWAWFLMARGIFASSPMAELILLWSAIAIVNHWWFVSDSKTHLFRHFRTLALKPYGAKNPPMESEWSAINWDEEVDACSSAPS